MLLGTSSVGDVLAYMVIALACAAAVVLLLIVLATALICAKYLKYIVRVFEEEPLLLPPHAAPAPDGEDVRFQTSDGLWLQGTWLEARTQERNGVVVFCHGFKMNRWHGLAYCDHLRDCGLDLFLFDFRNHGESDSLENYRPMQWVTEHEVRDVLAALQHARARQQDRDLPCRILLFGISRGGGAALVAASRVEDVTALVTDGAFPTHSMQLHFMLRWVGIFANIPAVYRRIPLWYYGLLCAIARWVTAARNRCWFPSIEKAAKTLHAAFWLCIHGQQDSYIPPDIARKLFELAPCPKEFWLVPGARHNQALRLHPEEYRQRLQDVALRYLVSESIAAGKNSS